MKSCPKCGKELPDNTKFCTKCGAKIPDHLCCPNCGKELPEGTVFCAFCGTQIQGVKPEPKKEESANAVTQSPVSATPVPVNTAFSAAAVMAPKKSKMIPIIIIFGVLLIVAAGAAALLLTPLGSKLFPPKRQTETVYKVSKIISLDKQGNILYTHENIYDETGNLLDGYVDAVFTHVISTYDEQGRVLTQTCMSDETTVDFTVEFTYDERGYVIKRHMDRFYTGPKEPSDTTDVEYSYNEYGCVLECWYENGELWERIERTFTGAGDMASETTFFPDEYVSSINYTYDKNGNCISEFEYYSDGTFYTTEHEYDENGVRIRTLSYDSDHNLYSETCYDEHGNPVTEKSFVLESELVHRYTYDEHGNIIRDDMVETLDGKKYDHIYEYEYQVFEVEVTDKHDMSKLWDPYS